MGLQRLSPADVTLGPAPIFKIFSEIGLQFAYFLIFFVFIPPQKMILLLSVRLNSIQEFHRKINTECTTLSSFDTTET